MSKKNNKIKKNNCRKQVYTPRDFTFGEPVEIQINQNGTTKKLRGIVSNNYQITEETGKGKVNLEIGVLSEDENLKHILIDYNSIVDCKKFNRITGTYTP